MDNVYYKKEKSSDNIIKFKNSKQTPNNNKKWPEVEAKEENNNLQKEK